MSASSKPSSPPRPFSLRPEDFLEDAPEKLKQDARAIHPEASPEESVGAPPPSFRAGDADPGSGVGRARTQSLAPSLGNSTTEKRKEEHTILMAVPPPAQVNDGK